MGNIPLQPLASLFTSLITATTLGTHLFSKKFDEEIGSNASKENEIIFWLIFIAACVVIVFDVVLMFMSVNKKQYKSRSKEAQEKIKMNKYYKIAKWIVFISSFIEFTLLLGEFLVSKPQSIVQYGRMIEQLTGKKASSFNAYGHWCGIRGMGDPVDAIDKCCMQHDACYRNVSYCESSSSVGLGQYNYQFNKTGKQIICKNPDNLLCKCDQESSMCIYENINVYDDKLKQFHYLDWGIDIALSNKFILVVVVSSISLFLVILRILFSLKWFTNCVDSCLTKVCCNYSSKTKPIFLSKLSMFFNSLADLIELIKRLELKAFICKVDSYKLVNNFVLVLLAIFLYLIDMLLFLTSNPPDDRMDPKEFIQMLPTTIANAAGKSRRSVSDKKSSATSTREMPAAAEPPKKPAAKWTFGKWLNVILKWLLLIVSLVLFINFIIIDYILPSA